MDSGNTWVKAALFREDSLQELFLSEDLGEVWRWAQGFPYAEALVSSVKYDETEIREIFGPDVRVLGPETPVPIRVAYSTPLTLGVDRKAALVGARVWLPEGPLLVADMGSCVTYDILTADDVFPGGVIAPGFRMRGRAMHAFTARLPEVAIAGFDPVPLIGTDTVSCMRSSLYYGIEFELLGYYERLRAEYPGLQVIISGGDAHYFERLVKDHIFVVPNLVLYGLNRILKYHV